MVLTSISTISSSVFLSDSPSTSNSNSTLFRNRPFPSFLVGFPEQPFSNATFKLKSSPSFSAISTQQEKGSLEQFIQYKEGIDGATDLLQTSIVSYKKKFPWSIFKPFLQVDLVSTVHIADKEYFLALQKKLESYDCVLYEMVASKEALEIMKKEPDNRSFKFSILGCIVRQMARILRLGYQSDCLNYQSENWQQADLDYETFELLTKAKGENLFSSANDIPLESIEAMLQHSIPEDLDPWRSKLLWASRVLPMPLVGFLIINGICRDYPEIEALSKLDFSAAMKVLVAKVLTFDLEQDTAEVDEKSVIIGERNRVAIERLRSAMDKGHNKIAILYGGGHMPDLGRRLKEEFDLIPSGLEWITAWSIRKRKVNTSSLPLLTTMALLIISPVLMLDLWFWKLFIGTAVNWGSQVLRFVGNYNMI
ncbi:uncharacterized protein LOC123884177 isoform X5 [Trifolium pratense]|uniref:uncharacterized protein LOC123884177 isoform X5 n=1 Tax=Trifolium pratense TaxID=57577 RepID=UPI001E692F35|nr:uncharacterized protein LOC123884177 isoform X5 [Trifolium pratense]